jgi:HEAT repeat protein/ATP/ADP translocase
MLNKNNTRSSQWLLFTFLFSCFAAAILGDSTAEALLLSHFSSDVIPRMFLINAIALFLISSFLISLVDRVDRGKFFQIALITHASVLVCIRFALEMNVTELYPFMFSYAYSTKIVFFLLFWTLANDITDSRRASKEFPFIAAGGTLGAIISSFAIPWLLNSMHTKDLLSVWCLLILVTSLMLIIVRKKFSAYLKPRSVTSTNLVNDNAHGIKKIFMDLAIVRKEPLLWNIAIIYFAVFFILFNQQYSFYYEVKNRIPSTRDMASFLGFFNGISMLITIILQIFASGFVLKKLGSSRAMLLLPICLLLIFLSHLLFHSFSWVGIFFWAVVGGMSLRMAFFDSFFSPNFQVFFSSLPREIRGRGKLSIEGIVKPLAIVLASGWIIFMSPHLSPTINLLILSSVSILIIVLTWKLRTSYADSLIRFLSGITKKDATALFDSNLLSNDKKYTSYIKELLTKEDFEIRKFIVESIASIKSDDALQLLLEQLKVADNRLKATIVANLKNYKNDRIKDVCVNLLSDSDSRVVANTIEILSNYKEEILINKLEQFLEYPNNRVRANTILALWNSVTDEKRTDLLQRLDHMIHGTLPNDIASALFVLGEIQSVLAEEWLVTFFENNKNEIQNGDRMIFRQLVMALSKKGSDRMLNILLVLGAHVNRIRKEEIIRNLCRMLESVSRQSFEMILERKPTVYRFLLLSAIHLQKAAYPNESAGVIRKIALMELNALNDTLLKLKQLKETSVGCDLLYSAIMEEYVELRFEILFVIASLFDSTGMIRSIITKLNHSNLHVRARAMEILDNTGDHKLNKEIIKLLELRDTVTNLPFRNDSNKVRAISVIDVWTHDENQWVSECARYSEYCVSEDLNKGLSSNLARLALDN